jgi:O-methyltransferase
MDELRNLYLDLIKRCILGLIYEDIPLRRWDVRDSQDFDVSTRENGYDWPSQAHSMIGLKRMDNIQYCVEKILEENIPGDFIETGVWRGGASIFMRALLKAYDISDRRVWLADSFEGLPPPNVEQYPQDKGRDLYKYKELAIALEDVQKNFSRYDLLDEQVKFIKGWFKDTLPSAEIDRISLLRLDGDLYESTMDSLSHLYPRLSIGGYVIVDDYALKPCRQAVEAYREKNNVSDEIIKIDWAGVYWKRTQ